MTSTSKPRSAADAGWLLIIDRYLLRQFLQSFVICFVSLTGLYVVIDGFGNLDEFITYAHKKGSLLAVMGEYYGYRSLSFFDRMSPVLTLIAGMFTVTWIQRHNELTALEAAGIAKGRIVRPVVVAAIAIILLSMANRELLLPAFRGQLSHNAQNLGGSNAQPLTPRYDNETGVFMGGSGSRTFADERRIHKPDFNLPPTLARYGAQLTAEDAFYRPPREGRPGGYLFRNVQKPKGLDKVPSLALGEQPILLTPQDNPAWLASNECFLVSEVSFEHLESGATWTQFSSTFELIRGLHNRSLEFGAPERLAIHARVVQPFLDLTLLFLGLPLVLSRSNRNVFVAIGICLGIVTAFMLMVLGCQYLGRSYWLEPSLAAWLPLFIFVPCAFGLAQPLLE